MAAQCITRTADLLQRAVGRKRPRKLRSAPIADTSFVDETELRRVGKEMRLSQWSSVISSTRVSTFHTACSCGVGARILPHYY